MPISKCKNLKVTKFKFDTTLFKSYICCENIPIASIFISNYNMLIFYICKLKKNIFVDFGERLFQFVPRF